MEKIFDYIEKEVLEIIIDTAINEERKSRIAYRKLVKKLSEEYHFSNEKIMNLLEYCKSRNGLKIIYILSVANWWYEQ